jgi:hypothetical protein
LFIIEAVCKSKWKSLRDNFRRELKKTIRNQLARIDEVSGWVHFAPLRFLEDVLDRKQIEMQILSGCCDNEGQNDFVNHCEIIINEEDEKIYECLDENEHQGVQQQQSRRMRESDVYVVKEEDENIHFFKSLLPYFKSMDMTSKLRVRIEIQKMLLEELLPKSDKVCDDEKPKKLDKISKSSLTPTRTSSRVVKKNRKYFRK